MRFRSLLLACLPATFALACNGQSSAPPASAGDDGGSSGGGEGGAVAFAYTPRGCSYSYSPPELLGFQDLALDDDGPVDAAKGVPERVRIGLGGGVTKGKAGYADPTTSAAFTWETAESDHAAKLQMGTSAGALTQTQAGYTWTIPSSANLGTAAYMHEVHVCGLEPATTYYYKVGGGPSGSAVWSAMQSFTTPPASGTFTVGILGDARDTLATWQLVNHRMKDADVALQLIDGDVVLAGAEEQVYQQWLDGVWKDSTSSTGFLTLGEQMMLAVDGNHENDVANSFSNWALPGVSGDPYAETYASFDLGSVHFVMLDDNQVSTLAAGHTNQEASAQLAWLDADLEAANADRTSHPFIVVMSHRGMFSTSNHGGDPDVLATRGALAPLFDKYKVDLALNGHDHEYERSAPLHAGNPPSGAPVVGSGTQYVICAGAGASPYAIGTYKQSYSAFQKSFCTQGSTGCTGLVGVYGLLTIGPSSLKWTAYGLDPSASTQADDPVVETVMLTPQ